MSSNFVQNLPTAIQIALYFSGLFYMVYIISGAWKWQAIRHASQPVIPPYLAITHQSALHQTTHMAISGLLSSLWPWEAVFPVAILISIMGCAMSLSLSRFIIFGVLQRSWMALEETRRLTRWALQLLYWAAAVPALMIGVGVIFALVN